MQNDFEQHISQRLQDFSLAPQPGIWQRVEAALPPQKKRRRILFWWWLPVAMGLLAGAGWLLLKPKPTPACETCPATAQKPSAHIPSAAQQASPAARPEPDTAPTQPGNISPEQPAIAITTPQAFPQTVHRQVANDRTRRDLPAAPGLMADKRVVTYRNTVSTILPQNDTASATLLASVPAIAKTALSFLPGLDSASTIDTASVAIIATQRDTTAKTTTDTLAPVQKAVAQKPVAATKQSGWMLEAGVGVSHLHRSTTGGNAGFVYDNYYVANPAGGLSGSPATIQPLVLPQSSFSLRLGISRKHTFSLHWQGQLAMQYQLVSATQRYGSAAGAGNYSQSTRYDSAAFFTAGTGNTYRNTQHQLQLTPRLAYCINPKAALPVDFHAGVSIGYNLHSNLLLHDYRSRSYVRSAAYTARWQVAAAMGFGIFIHNTIYTGLLYQQGLSNVSRSAVQSDFRWRVWQVQVGVPLLKKKPKG